MIDASGSLWLVPQMNDVLPRRLHVRGRQRLVRWTPARYWTVALPGFGTYRRRDVA